MFATALAWLAVAGALAPGGGVPPDPAGRSFHVEYSWLAAGHEPLQTEALEVDRVTPARWLTRIFLVGPRAETTAIVTELHLPRQGKDVYRVVARDRSWFELCSVSGLKLKSTSDLAIGPKRAARVSRRDYPVELTFRSSLGDGGRVATRLWDATADDSLARALTRGRDRRRLAPAQAATMAWLADLAGTGEGDDSAPLAGLRPLLRVVAAAYAEAAEAAVPGQRLSWTLTGGIQALTHGKGGVAIADGRELALLAHFAAIDPRDPLAGAAALDEACAMPGSR
ncbi:MAG TPA: hypothetical protein VE075_12230 [Thermoanaerobaculia bacterium]|nr:hypothetical protein [Thermoanaerobaculia bacterium]